MPASYYRSTLTTALNDNENRNTLFKRRWLLSMSFSVYVLPCLKGPGERLKHPLRLTQNPSLFPCSIDSVFYSLQRTNWIPVCGCLSDETLKPRGSLWPVGTLEFLSCCPWSEFQNLAWPQMSQTRLWGEMIIRAFLPSGTAVSMMWPAAFTLSFSSALKSTPSNKRVCLRVKGLQIWACYLYSIICE